MGNYTPIRKSNGQRGCSKAPISQSKSARVIGSFLSNSLQFQTVKRFQRKNLSGLILAKNIKMFSHYQVPETIRNNICSIHSLKSDKGDDFIGEDQTPGLVADGDNLCSSRVGSLVDKERTATPTDFVELKKSFYC